MPTERMPKQQKPHRISSDLPRKGPGEKPVKLGLNQPGMLRLQKLAGNQAVQRLIQRSALTENTVPFELDDITAGQIEQARGGGQPIDSTAQTNLEPNLGYDLSSVKIHNTEEDNALSQTVGAKAFTIGQDIFFKEGAYNPHSNDGQQLLAHELTHVVQQNNGDVSSTAKMSVNAPGDTHEKEAEQAAKSISAQASTSASQAQIQRKEEEF